MKSKPRFLLNILFTYLAFAVSIIFLEQILYHVPSESIGENHAMFYIFGILSVALIVFYFVSEYKRNGKFQLKPLFLLVGGIVLLSGLLSIWVQPFSELLIGSSGAEVTFTFGDKVRYSLRLVVFLGVICLIIHAFRNKKFSFKSFHWIYYVMIIIGLVSVIISLVIEWDKYVTIMTLDTDSSTRFPTIVSIYGNENVYGITLAFSLASVLLVREMKKHWWHILTYFILLFELVLTSSVASLFGVFIFSAAYFLYKTITGLMKTHVKHLIYVAVYVFIVVAFIVSFYFFDKYDIKPMSNLVKFVREQILDKDYGSLSGRTSIWSEVWKVTSRDLFTLFFGRGYGMGLKIFQYQYAFDLSVTFSAVPTHVHSGFFDIFLEFGLIGVAVYFIGIFYFLYSIFCLFKARKTDFAFVYLVIFIGLSALGTLEDIYPFKGSINGLFFGAAFLMPSIAMIKKEKQNIDLEVEQKDIVHQKEISKDQSPLMIVMLLSILFSTLAALVNKNVTSDLINGCLMVCIIENAILMIITSPLIFSLISTKDSYYFLKIGLYYLICLTAPILLTAFGVFGLIPVQSLFFLPLLVHFIICFAVIFVICIANEKTVNVSSIFAPYKEIGLYGILSIFVGAATTLILSIICLVLFPQLKLVLVLFIIGIGPIVTLFMLMLPKKNQMSTYIDFLNSVYNQYEVFLLKRENGEQQ